MYIWIVFVLLMLSFDSSVRFVQAAENETESNTTTDTQIVSCIPFKFTVVLHRCDENKNNDNQNNDNNTNFDTNVTDLLIHRLLPELQEHGTEFLEQALARSPADIQYWNWTTTTTTTNTTTTSTTTISDSPPSIIWNHEYCKPQSQQQDTYACWLVTSQVCVKAGSKVLPRLVKNLALSKIRQLLQQNISLPCLSSLPWSSSLSLIYQGPFTVKSRFLLEFQGAERPLNATEQAGLIQVLQTDWTKLLGHPPGTNSNSIINYQVQSIKIVMQTAVVAQNGNDNDQYNNANTNHRCRRFTESSSSSSSSSSSWLLDEPNNRLQSWRAVERLQQQARSQSLPSDWINSNRYAYAHHGHYYYHHRHHRNLDLNDFTTTTATLPPNSDVADVATSVATIAVGLGDIASGGGDIPGNIAGGGEGSISNGLDGSSGSDVPEDDLRDGMRNVIPPRHQPLANSVEVVLTAECESRDECTLENLQEAIRTVAPAYIGEDGKLLLDKLRQDALATLGAYLGMVLKLVFQQLLKWTSSSATLDINITELLENAGSRLPPAPTQKEFFERAEVPWWIYLIVAGCCGVWLLGAAVAFFWVRSLNHNFRMRQIYNQRHDLCTDNKAAQGGGGGGGDRDCLQDNGHNDNDHLPSSLKPLHELEEEEEKQEDSASVDRMAMTTHDGRHDDNHDNHSDTTNTDNNFNPFLDDNQSSSNENADKQVLTPKE